MLSPSVAARMTVLTVAALGAAVLGWHGSTHQAALHVPVASVDFNGRTFYTPRYIDAAPYAGPHYATDTPPSDSAVHPKTFALPNGWKIRASTASDHPALTRQHMIDRANSNRDDKTELLAVDLVHLSEGNFADRLVYLTVKRYWEVDDPRGHIGGGPPMKQAGAPDPPPIQLKWVQQVSFTIADPYTGGVFEGLVGSADEFKAGQISPIGS